MTRRARAASLLASLSLLSACGSGDAETTLTIEAVLNLCGDSDACVSVPAAGASFIVYRNEQVVSEGVVDSSGGKRIDISPGRYSAAISLPEIGLDMSTPRTELPAIDAAEGESAELQVVLVGSVAPDVVD